MSISTLYLFPFSSNMQKYKQVYKSEATLLPYKRIDLTPNSRGFRSGLDGAHSFFGKKCGTFSETTLESLNGSTFAGRLSHILMVTVKCLKVERLMKSCQK